MEDLLATVSPWIVKVQDALMWVAEKIANSFNFDVNNAYLLVLIVVSLFVGKKIFNLFYSSDSGRGHIWLIFSAIIFSILKFL